MGSPGSMYAIVTRREPQSGQRSRSGSHASVFLPCMKRGGRLKRYQQAAIEEMERRAFSVRRATGRTLDRS
jgi:hypothetical protein